MTTESVPDCHLITKERILIEAHKIIMFQSPYLCSLITSVSCANGKCPIQERVTLIFPDVSYRHLDPIIQYFYTGRLVFPATEKAAIADLLIRLFKIPSGRENSLDSEYPGQDIRSEVQDICVPDVSPSDQLNKQQQDKKSQENEKTREIAFSFEVIDEAQEEQDQQKISNLAEKLLDEVEDEVNQNSLLLGSYSDESEGFNKRKKPAVHLPRIIKISNMECSTCHYKVKRSSYNMKRHLVLNHLHSFWPEVSQDDICCQDCDFVAVSRIKLIWHLAIEHGQFELKLEERNQTISNYITDISFDIT